MDRIYVVGLRESGGAWLSTFGYYADYAVAERVALITGKRVFTLRPGDPPTPAHGNCPGAYLINQKCSRCGARL